MATSDFNADFGGAAPLLGLFEESGEGENACAEAASRMAAVTVVTFTIMYRRGRFSSSIYVGFGLGVLLILPALFFLSDMQQQLAAGSVAALICVVATST